jgi:hypothetical protein
MRIHVLDRTGHSTLCATAEEATLDPRSRVVDDLQAEFDRLCAKGYAMFIDEQRVAKTTRVVDIPAEAEILALAPLVGG